MLTCELAAEILLSPKLSWGCFLAKPLKISTLVMELFFLVRIRRIKWDMSEQNPWDLIFSSTLAWENAALVDGGGKIFLSPRNWETDLRWASGISRCVVELNLSFWDHVTKAHRLYTAPLNAHLWACSWDSSKSKTQLRLFPGQTIENKYPSDGAFFSSQDQAQKMRYVWAKSVRFDFLLNQNAALVDGGGKIFLSPRKWETDLRWASDISRCVVEPNLSFWEHVTKAHRLYTAPLNAHICFVHFSMLCPLSYVGYLQDYSKSKKIDFENALRATVLKIQPCALVHISFSHRTVPAANLGQIRQPSIFLKFPDFNAAKSRLGGIF